MIFRDFLDTYSGGGGGAAAGGAAEEAAEEEEEEEEEADIGGGMDMFGGKERCAFVTHELIDYWKLIIFIFLSFNRRRWRRLLKILLIEKQTNPKLNTHSSFLLSFFSCQLMDIYFRTSFMARLRNTTEKESDSFDFVPALHW